MNEILFCHNRYCFVHWFHWHWFQQGWSLFSSAPCWSGSSESVDVQFPETVGIYCMTLARSRGGERTILETCWGFQSVWNSWCSLAAKQPQPSCLAVQTGDPSATGWFAGNVPIHLCVFMVWLCGCSHAEHDWAFHLLCQRVSGPHKIGCFQVC